MFRKLFCSLLLTSFLLFSGATSAEEIFTVDATLLASTSIGERLVYNGPENFPVYENLTNDSTIDYFNGGSVAGITRMVFDDTTPTRGGLLDRFVFSVVNGNGTDVSARPRVRWWAADGAGGGPGTFLGGVTFNPITFGANTRGLFAAGGIEGFGLVLPNAPMWWGTTFDNDSGATLATDAELNLLGMMQFDPATLGSTNSSLYFESTDPGSFFGVDDPVGSLGTLANGPSSFAYSYETFAIPEPGSIAILGLGSVGLFVRRRRS